MDGPDGRDEHKDADEGVDDWGPGGPLDHDHTAGDGQSEGWGKACKPGAGCAGKAADRDEENGERGECRWKNGRQKVQESENGSEKDEE